MPEQQEADHVDADRQLRSTPWVPLPTLRRPLPLLTDDQRARVRPDLGDVIEYRSQAGRTIDDEGDHCHRNEDQCIQWEEPPMAEHRPGPARPLSELVDVRDCLTLPAIPTVYGLHHPEDGVTAWVFALPDGRAYIVPSDEEGTGMIHASLDLIQCHWAPLRDAQLVLVAAG